MPRVQVQGVGVVQFPDDMPPDQIATAIERDILPRAAMKGGEPPAPARSTGEELTRQAGLTARYAIEGLAGIPAIIADPISRLAGAKPFGEWLSEKLTDVGLPSPETQGERLVGDVSRGLAGGGGTVALGKGLAGATNAVTRGVGETLAANAGAQAAGGGTAAGAAGVAREEGASPLVQLAIGMATGFLTPASIEAARLVLPAAGRAAKQVVKPFSAAGREEVAGATLKRIASDADAATANMGDAPEIVPGSLPTTAQASRDLGLLQAERTLAATDPRFAARKSANNAARNRALEDIAGTREDVDAAKDARAKTAEGNYDKAEAGGFSGENDVDLLLSLAQRPAFKDAVKTAAKIAAESGQPVDDVMSSVRGLHLVKLALDDMLDTAAVSGIGKAQRRAIAQTREDLLSWLDKASPDYAAARAQYRADSVPINRMEAGQDIQARTRLAGPDVTGEPILSQAKWQNVVTRKLDELGNVMSDEQMQTLRAIGEDLDRASLSDTAGRAVGSNTFQNLSTANLLGAAVGKGLSTNSTLQTLARPLRWLYQIPEEQVRDLVVQAMLDPSIAKVMMSKATPANVDMLSEMLKFATKARGLGAAATVGATETAAR